MLDTLGVGSPAQLQRLEALAPKAPVYFDGPTRQDQHHFERRWRLLVPLWLPNGLRGQGDLVPERE